MNSPDDAYTTVTNSEMAAAYVAIELDDSNWPSDGLFTIGEDTSTTSRNQPLRAGFAYRAFIRAYPLNVCYFTNKVSLLSLICCRVKNSLAHLHPVLFQRFLKIHHVSVSVYM